MKALALLAQRERKIDLYVNRFIARLLRGAMSAP
jgi:hypothetical protein